jgi:hypothetical protein
MYNEMETNMEALEGQRSEGLQECYKKVKHFAPAGDSKIRGVEADA